MNRYTEAELVEWLTQNLHLETHRTIDPPDGGQPVVHEVNLVLKGKVIKSQSISYLAP